MSKDIKKKDLENMVKSFLGEALKKRAIENKIKKINEDISKLSYNGPDFEVDEYEIYPGKAVEDGRLSDLSDLLPYVNSKEGGVDSEFDYIELGVDYEGDVQGEYSPSTRYTPSGDVGDPAEYPEVEFTINDFFVKNHKNDQWERVDDNHVLLMVDPDLKINFESKHGDDISYKIEKENSDI